LLRANSFLSGDASFSLTLSSDDLQNRLINLLGNSIRVPLPSRRTRILVKMDHVIVKRIVIDSDSLKVSTGEKLTLHVILYPSNFFSFSSNFALNLGIFITNLSWTPSPILSILSKASTSNVIL